MENEIDQGYRILMERLGKLISDITVAGKINPFAIEPVARLLLSRAMNIADSRRKLELAN